ncbi:MAG: serine hydrolase [Acidimicrobiales bacterium]
MTDTSTDGAPPPSSSRKPTRRPPLPPQPDGMAWPTDTWPTSDPADDVDADRLTSLVQRGFGPDPEAATADNLALVVIHRGRLVTEAYGPNTASDDTLISWSMGKSITQALVGLLTLDGLIDVDQPADVARWADDDRRTITTRDLLRMTSGLEFVEDYVDDQISHVIEMLFGAGRGDVAGYAESFPLLHAPGTTFSYSSGTTNIIAALCGRLIAGTPGRPAVSSDADAVRGYLDRRLFGPIGMSSAIPKFDDAGTFIGSSFVYATAQDFARFGYLYLRDGVWDGERLLPVGWVDAARTPVDPHVDEEHWYGEHWWLWPDDTAAFACQGYEGQRIVVVPERDLVIVRLGKTDASRSSHVNAWLTEIIGCFPTIDAPIGAR